MTNPTAEQPPPAPTGQPPTWPRVVKELRRLDALMESRAHVRGGTAALVLADMEARDATGRERYGVPLSPHNGRDSLVDAYQECLDLIVYLRNALAEAEDDGDEGSCLISLVGPLYWQAIEMALKLRQMIRDRG